MSSKAWAREMALYNTWQNDTLFGHCAAMSETERRQDRGMFFDNIHHTLDHILMVDERLLHCVVNGAWPDAAFEPRKLVRGEFATLKADREAFDRDLLAMIEGWGEDWLDEMLEVGFGRGAEARTRTLPRMLFAMQLFNHATHHRSQVTVELHKLGIDYGNTDLPFNPHSQY